MLVGKKLIPRNKESVVLIFKTGEFDLREMTCKPLCGDTLATFDIAQCLVTC